MLGDISEVVVSREHRKIAAKAELSEKGVNRADLNAVAAAGVSQLRGVAMITPIGSEQGEVGKPLDNLFAGS
jgi:hypothetical protein